MTFGCNRVTDGQSDPPEADRLIHLAFDDKALLNSLVPSESFANVRRPLISLRDTFNNRALKLFLANRLTIYMAGIFDSRHWISFMIDKGDDLAGCSDVASSC